MANKKIKVVSGDGKNLNVSDVKDHIKIDKKKDNIKKDNIIIPTEKKWLNFSTFKQLFDSVKEQIKPNIRFF